MAVPKRKKSKSKTGMRKSANMKYAKRLVNVLEDKTTGEFKLAHHISLDGTYNGRDVYEKADASPFPEAHEVYDNVYSDMKPEEGH